jgi:hypothetical protein
MIKRLYLVPFLVVVLAFSALRAQSLVQSPGNTSLAIEYQWPRNGDVYVPQKTTFIVRPSKSFMNGRSAKDFIFTVDGELSGAHSGKVLISSDEQTVIFIPAQPFALNENVTVRLEISGAENIAPLSYSFHITSMSEEDCGHALYALHEREDAENEAAMKNSAEAIQSPLPTFDDTIAFAPTTVVLDTVTTFTGEGNIFFSPTARGAHAFSFLAIASDAATKALPDSNNFLFVRDIRDPQNNIVNTGNFRMQPDGTLTYFREVTKSATGGVFFGQIEHLDQHMKIIDTFQCRGFSADLHDFQLLFNKRAILVAYDPQKFPIKKYFDTVANGAYKNIADSARDTVIVFGAIIQELDENKNPVFTWRSWDHFQIIDATRDIKLTDTLIDYMHINTAISDPQDGNFIASFRHCDEVTKINSNDGSFIWRWGGKHNQFAFLGDTLQFSHQHDPARIKNGNITMWDNGNLHTKKINGIDSTVPSSRAIEYNLDEVNHKATTIWQYTDVPYSQAAGNVQRFDNGNTLIGLGIVTQPSALEVTHDGSRILRMSMPTGSFSYRTYRFPFTPLSSVRQTGTASSFCIGSIYPNPALNSATIAFSVAEPGMMQIELIDILGHRVRSIGEKLSGAGTYSADLDLHGLPAGAYYCKLSQAGASTMKMLIVQE